MRSLRTMSMRAGRFASAVALFSVAFAAPAADDDTRFTMSLGGQEVLLDDDDARDSKFQEYRDIPQNVLVDRLHFAWMPPGDPWSLTLDGRNVLRTDQRYRLTFGKAGGLQVHASWLQVPHFHSREATFLHAGGAGEFTLANDFRQVLEDAATGGTIAAIMPDVLARSADPRDILMRRDRAEAGVRIPLGSGWKLSLDALHENRTGESRISTGTYIRSSTASSFDAERFEPRGLEMPEPVDRSITEAGFDLGLHRDRGFFSLGYRLSDFQNDVSALVWDNPFEASPGASSSSLGLFTGADQEPSAAQGNTSGTANRGRFDTGTLDLYPDNQYQRLYVTGAVTLPGKTRLSATVALATMEQDDAFLPYTSNRAVCFNAGIDNVCGTADAGEVLAADQPLPRENLDGEIRTTRTDVRVTSRPVAPLTLRGSYRRYDYDDRTEEIHFPGYAAAGESYFRPSIGQRDAADNRVLFTEVGGYTRSVVAVGAAWRIVPAVTVDVEGSVTTWDYDKRQVESTDEDALRAKLRVAPVDWFEARLTWLDASRTFEGDYQVGLETSGVRAFDVWDRDRTRYGVELDFMPGDAWSFGAAWSSWEDEYPGAVEAITPFPYGLGRTENDSASAWIGYGGKRWDLSAAAGFESGAWESLSVTKTSFSGALYDPDNRWTRAQDDDLLWANVWFRAELVPAKVRLLGDVTVSRYEGELATANPSTPDINSAVAYPFPDLEETLLSARLSLLWDLSKHLTLEARVWYEPYDLEDFMWDSMKPYMQGTIQEARTSPTDIRDANVNRLLFLDSRYSDYTASVLYAGLRLTY